MLSIDPKNYLINTLSIPEDVIKDYNLDTSENFYHLNSKRFPKTVIVMSRNNSIEGIKEGEITDRYIEYVGNKSISDFRYETDILKNMYAYEVEVDRDFMYPGFTHISGFKKIRRIKRLWRR